MLPIRVSHPQFVEHAIPGFLILRVTPMLPRACAPELGVKSFKRRRLAPEPLRSHDGAVSVIPTTAVSGTAPKRKRGAGQGGRRRKCNVSLRIMEDQFNMGSRRNEVSS